MSAVSVRLDSNEVLIYTATCFCIQECVHMAVSFAIDASYYPVDCGLMLLKFMVKKEQIGLHLFYLVVHELASFLKLRIVPLVLNLLNATCAPRRAAVSILFILTCAFIRVQGCMPVHIAILLSELRPNVVDILKSVKSMHIEYP